MKRFFTIIFCLVSLGVTGQEYADTTYSNGINDVFYSFRGGVLKTVPSDNWDIAFEINGFTASIIINDGAGVELYKAPYNSSQWSSFDTTGMSGWSRQHNSLKYWEQGAFNRGLSGDVDLGWGKYDLNTHQVVGDSVFLIRLRNGDYKKIMIINLASNTYHFKYANVDGSNETSKALAKSSFSGKTFGYFSIVDGTSLDREPSGTQWDLVFTTYLLPINMGTIVYYPVYGVKSNKGVEIARRTGVDVSNNDTFNLTWEYNITNIGSDWKVFDNQNQVYNMVENLSFFIKTNLKEVWKMYFTEYVGGNEGMSVFNVTGLSTSSITESLKGKIKVYPNPANSVLKINSEVNLSNVELTLVDLQGRSVNSVSEALEMNVSDLSSGIYMLQLISNEGTFTQRVIIQ